MASLRPAVGPHSASPAELKERIEADRQGAPYLVFRDGDGVQRIVALHATEARRTVGRDATVALCLAWDDQVSRVHAELERLGEDWTVVDDGLSRNGTWVNGERIAGRRRLCAGDVIRFGATQVAFRAPNRVLNETRDAAPMKRPSLSEAQRRVLVALCRPCRGGATHAAPATNRQIADELVLSIEGVKSHLRALFERFGVEDLPQNSKRGRLVELAFETGAITERELDA